MHSFAAIGTATVGGERVASLTDAQSHRCVGPITSPPRAVAAAEPAAPILLDFSAAFGNH